MHYFFKSLWWVGTVPHREFLYEFNMVEHKKSLTAQIKSANEIDCEICSVYMLLSDQQYEQTVSWCCIENSAIFRGCGIWFIDWIVTKNKTWIHHWTTKFKRQSMVWKEKDKAAPKRLSCGIGWKGNDNSLFEFQGSVVDPHRTTITATL